ncbi:MAG: hypothetical protein ACKOYM_00890 [Actinomycetes bacterium]
MKFTRNSVAVVVAIVASLSAGTAAVAMNLGAADSGVPSPAGRLTTETSAPPQPPATIYVDETVVIPLPAERSATADSPVASAPTTDPATSGASSADRPASVADEYDSDEPDDDYEHDDGVYEGHDDDD